MISKILILLFIDFSFFCHKSNQNAMCNEISYEINVTVNLLGQLARDIVPQLDHAKGKGEAGGRIGIIGGSEEFAGATYFAAISALKGGADLVHVVTTESAASVIRTYNSDIAVYSYLDIKSISKMSSVIKKLDVVVLGPGLAENNEAIAITENVINLCRTLVKPMVIDANALSAIVKNLTLLKDYPGPGVILTPNKSEARKLKEAINRNYTSDWFSFWGDNVSVLVKGQTDQFFSRKSMYGWSSSQGGSGRRTAGQGDILSGFLGTVFGWAIKYDNYGNYQHDCIAQSVATYASAKFTRLCNTKALEMYGRNMITSDMIGQIHKAFKEMF